MPPSSVDFSPFFEGVTLRFVPGIRDTDCSLDTLKKEYAPAPRSSQGGFPGFWQVLPQSAVAGESHLAWCVFSVLAAQQSKSLHFRQPELELLARVAGTFQWGEAKARAGLTDSDEKVVLVWVGPTSALSAAQFSSIAKKWGLKPGKWAPSKVDMNMAIERSALAALT